MSQQKIWKDIQSGNMCSLSSLSAWLALDKALCQGIYNILVLRLVIVFPASYNSEHFLTVLTVEKPTLISPY